MKLVTVEIVSKLKTAREMKEINVLLSLEASQANETDKLLKFAENVRDLASVKGSEEYVS
ncbi:MAG: hypothetical protein LKJ22_00875 [Liquorilactobacillus nagelii]|jgi:adenine C2-methylase RlmN of 23S rRNA A2503 and tRNA A37|uniref:hypothetical protein n=1 Tax=Liquorilactobacillus nagelii TaxID=82688 RepID=UPI00242F10C9|nr:hypothetical protein [Liquorilactobacillus nagelii]MCI1920456.1 hypothetical protein [Liquorilactobacillus nagelii]MCI1976100.1 hypothetical protein [Liquorilactobacillus nagelii]